MDDILEYCSITWGVTFPVFDKVRVNGKKAAPLYKELTKAEDDDGKAGRVEWNFEKFLVLPERRRAALPPEGEARRPGDRLASSKRTCRTRLGGAGTLRRGFRSARRSGDVAVLPGPERLVVQEPHRLGPRGLSDRVRNPAAEPSSSRIVSAR